MTVAPSRARPSPRRVSGVPLLAVLVALLLGGATALVVTAGPVEFGTDRLGGWVSLGLVTPTAPSTASTATAQPRDLPDLQAPGWLPAVSVLVVSMLVALAVRSLLRVSREPDPPAPPPVASDPAGDAGTLHLGVLRRALDDGAVRLRSGEHQGVADEVVRCWEALEVAAGSRGVPRPPHQTPSEFGVQLLRTLGADPAATDDLLHLYHRARFSSAVMGDPAALRAAADLDAIARSLDRPVGGG